MKYSLMIFIILLQNYVFAQDHCLQLFSAPKPHEFLKQIAESKSTSQLLRSNSEQYWAWAKVNASKMFNSQVLSHIGNVVGDPHNKNFGIVKYAGKIFWTVVDTDDAGRAPFILDFARYVAAVKAVEDIKTKDLWSAYISGLQGEKLNENQPIVEKYLQMTP